MAGSPWAFGAARRCGAGNAIGVSSGSSAESAAPLARLGGQRLDGGGELGEAGQAARMRRTASSRTAAWRASRVFIASTASMKARKKVLSSSLRRSVRIRGKRPWESTRR